MLHLSSSIKWGITEVYCSSPQKSNKRKCCTPCHLALGWADPGCVTGPWSEQQQEQAGKECSSAPPRTCKHCWGRRTTFFYLFIEKLRGATGWSGDIMYPNDAVWANGPPSQCKHCPLSACAAARSTVLVPSSSPLGWPRFAYFNNFSKNYLLLSTWDMWSCAECAACLKTAECWEFCCWTDSFAGVIIALAPQKKNTAYGER